MLRTKKRRAALAVAVVLALVWLLWPDRQMARVRALQAELGDASLSDEQRRDKFREMREVMAHLSPAQREMVVAGQRNRMEDDLRKYARMSPPEKKQYLDQRINREEQMRQQWAKAGGPAKGGGPGVFAAPGGSSSAKSGPKTPEERERRRSGMLDRSTPEFRGLMDQYRRDMEQRRKQRGLPPGPGGR